MLSRTVSKLSQIICSNDTLLSQPIWGTYGQCTLFILGSLESS